MSHMRRVYRLAAIFIVLALTLISPSLLGFKARAACGAADYGNANGHFHLTYNCRICTDPNTGYLVGWEFFGPATWTTNDGVVHGFGVVTVFDTSGICADDVPSDSGPSIDGEFTIRLTAYTHATIWNSSGVQVLP